MKAHLLASLDALGRFFGSMKTWTLIMALAVSAFAHWQIEVSPTTQAEILGLFAILLGAQGAADHGKEAAKTTADATVTAARISAGAAPVPTAQVVNIANPPAGSTGSTSVSLMFALTIATGLVLAGIALAGCATLKSDAKADVKSTIDCLESDAAKEFQPTIDQLIVKATTGDGTIDRATLKAGAKNFTAQLGGCALATGVQVALQAIAAAKADPSAPKASAVEARPDDLRAAFDELRATAFGGATFKTSAGVL